MDDNSLNNFEDSFPSFTTAEPSRSSFIDGGLRVKNIVKVSKRHEPLVSIVTIVFNGEQYIEQTIKSVLEQSYSNVELIIIDGESVDSTLDKVKKYENEIDYWVSQKDVGISDAFNKGLKLCKGELIAFLNADDYYIDNCVVQRVVNEYIEHRNDDLIIYGDTKRLKEDGNIEHKRDANISWAMSIPFSHCSSFITAKTIKSIGLYSLKYKIAMDVDFILRAKQISKLKKVNFYIGVQRDGGISGRHRLKGYKEYLKISNEYYGLKAYFFYVLKLLIYIKNKVKL